MTNLLLASIFFVSPAGSDTNAGTLQAPIRHLQSAIDRATYGDTINVMPGLYREQVYVDGRYWPTNGATGSATNRLLIQAYGSPVIIQASERVSAWTPVNDPVEWGKLSGEPFSSNCIFQTDWVVPSGEVVQLVMEAEDRPMRDAPFLLPHTYLYRCGRLYIWPEKAPFDGIEIGGGNSAFEEVYGNTFRAEMVDFLKLKGLQFRYSGTGFGGSSVALGRFCWIENCKISWADFQGLSLWNGVVTNCTIIACGAKGLENAWSNSIVVDSVIGGNNWRGFSQGGQAAGLKLITRRVTGDPAYSDSSGNEIRRCLFVTNCADAIWSDTMIAASDRPFVIVDNSISNNSGGIFLEISSGVQVLRNLLVANTNKGINLRWGSSNTIAGNTVITTENATLSSGPFHMRAEGDTEMGIRNVGNVVVSNFFSSAIQQAVISTGQDGPTPDAAYYGNVYAWNTITNTVMRTQLNVWAYPYLGGPTAYFTPGEFESAANGEREDFGNRPKNHNVGNR